MKVAYVVSLFPCWSETFILREVQELARRGIEVRIFSLRRATEKLVQPEAVPFLGRVRYPSWRGSVRSSLRRLFRDPLGLVRVGLAIVRSMGRSPSMLVKSLAMVPRALHFLDLIREEGFDHIHAHWATYPATAAWIFKSLEGLPYSFTAHAHDIWLARPLLEEKIEGARFVATISEFNRRYLLPHAGCDPGKLRVIHCGLDLRRFPVRWEDPALPCPRILAAGRLDEIKGFPHLIDACRELSRRGVPYQAKVIGDGPLRAKLEDQVRAGGLEDRVTLSPALPQEELAREIRASTLFVLPSIRTPSGNQDGIPVVLMEAMALGVPVVSTAVAGIPELIQSGVNGVLVEPGSPRDLAEAIRSLLADRSARERLSRAARGTVERGFDITASVDLLLRGMAPAAPAGDEERTLDESYIS